MTDPEQTFGRRGFGDRSFVAIVQLRKMSMALAGDGTCDVALPMDGYARMSMVLEPRGSKTSLTIRIAEAVAPGQLRTSWLRFVSKTFFAKKVAEDWRQSLENLVALVAAEVPTRDSAVEEV